MKTDVSWIFTNYIKEENQRFWDFLDLDQINDQSKRQADLSTRALRLKNDEVSDSITAIEVV